MITKGLGDGRLITKGLGGIFRAVVNIIRSSYIELHDIYQKLTKPNEITITASDANNYNISVSVNSILCVAYSHYKNITLEVSEDI